MRPPVGLVVDAKEIQPLIDAAVKTALSTNRAMTTNLLATSPRVYRALQIPSGICFGTEKLYWVVVGSALRTR